MSIDQTSPHVDAPPSVEDGIDASEDQAVVDHARSDLGAEEHPEAPMGAGQWARLAGVLGLLVVLTALTGVWGLVMVMGIVVMIFLHELGHFVMAKRAGMEVTEFFLGFGPRIWSFHRAGTEYGLKLVPAGAYVKITGMHNLEEVDPAHEARTYRQQPFWPRFRVAVAGSTMHFIMAFVLLYTLLVGFGLPGGSLAPDPSQWRVGAISEDSAAEAAGLRAGDDIVALDDTQTPTFDALREAVWSHPGDEVTLTIVRDGETIEVPVTIGEVDGSEGGFLGVGQTTPREKLGPVEAVPATVREFGVLAGQSVAGLARVFTPSGISSFGRQVVDAGEDSQAAEQADEAPVSPQQAQATESQQETRLLSLLGVFRIGVDSGTAGGIASILILFTFINMFVGIFNLIPMLPFDGGHVAIAVYERIQERRKHLTHRYFADVGKLMPMTYAVVFVLGLIFISSLYLDIANPLSVN